MKNFRLLRADEIDCRVAQVFKNGTCTLLLYKDARCDMNILDETVGTYNWNREHTLIDGQLFCRVGVREVDENGYTSGFVYKEDVGTESYTEAEKGRASDSFKRACVNWGIGRELYSAPRITVPCTVKEVNGKLKTYDQFAVTEIGYDDRENINLLSITKDGAEVYRYDKSKETTKPTETHLRALRAAMINKGIGEADVCKRYKVARLEDLTMDLYYKAAKAVEKSGGAE